MGTTDPSLYYRGGPHTFSGIKVGESQTLRCIIEEGQTVSGIKVGESQTLRCIIEEDHRLRLRSTR